MLLHGGAVGGDAFQGEEGVVAQPFVERQPLLRGFQGEVVGADGAGRAGAGPAQQPALAVGEHAHTDALAGGFGLLQVAVQLGDIFGVGGAAVAGGAGSSDAPLELDEGVQGGEVHGLAAGAGGRVFLDDGVGMGQAGEGEEVADGAGDVGFGGEVVVAGEDGPGGGLVAGVVDVQVRGHTPAGAWP